MQYQAKVSGDYMSNQDCIFCKIIKKQVPASVLLETEDTLAFLDIRPLNMGHTLIIPKNHYAEIFDIPENELCQVYKIAKQMAVAVKKATMADGITVIQQNGRAAGQDIFHLHVHVVPRFQGENLPKFSDLNIIEREKLEEMAMKIKEKL
jgi:histidine triad (HIT) family protein